VEPSHWLHEISRIFSHHFQPVLIPLPKSVSTHYQYIRMYISLYIDSHTILAYKWIMKATWIAKKIEDDRFYGICEGFACEGQ
jgi:hypothetical protein